MPHVIVKLWPGKSEQQKTRLAGSIDQRHNGNFALRGRVGFGSHGRSET